MLVFGIFPYRPSVIELGNPVSQVLGVFQGRAERFSDSVLAQPLNQRAANASRSRNAWRGLSSRFFMTEDKPGLPGHLLQLRQSPIRAKRSQYSDLSARW